MQLDGLSPLYQSMRAQNLGRVKFRYNLNHLVFDCLFFADMRPFELVMGCLGHNFAIFLEVHKGFVIRPFIGPPETFNALCEALFQGKGSGNRFQASAFFAEFNRHIPTQATPDQAASAADVLHHYPDIEEADKRWFCGWLDNTKQGNRVTSGNLVKTRRLMNQAAHDFALRRNMSTRWTHEESRAMEMFFPE